MARLTEHDRQQTSVEPGERTFSAVLEPDHTSLRWTVARLPFDSRTAWPHMLRRRVAGTVNGFAFRTSLFPPIPAKPGEILIVNKQMQKGAGVRLGDIAHFALGPDLNQRPAALPSTLIAAFEGDRALRRWTESLSESNRREIEKWIAQPSSPSAKASRAARMAERLLLAMEGERELPPILEALFRHNPQARTGWHALTPNQRRSHLLGIFYYQTPEARIRRAEKAVEDALSRTARPGRNKA